MTRTRFQRRRSFAAAALLALAGGGCSPSERPAAAAAAERGLWLGPIHLCRDRVAEAKAGLDDIGVQPALRMVLAPALQPRLSRVTAAHVNRTMAIRLDGRVLQEPRINEPITGTALVLMGGSSEEVEAMLAATRQPC